jgi:hypothetical protein
VGHYCFRADYQGDSNYPAASDRSLTECFQVTPVTPTISTSASGPVHLGTAIDDTATLGGAATKPGTGGLGDGSINPTAQAAAGGTITFSLYGPSATPSCLTAIATRGVNVSGNGNYNASSGTGTGSLIPSSVGTYYWIATYSGDSPNTSGPVSTACGDAGEVSVVNNTTSVTTPESSSGTSIANGSVSIGTGSVQVKDLAVVTGAGSTANPTGTVKFFLCGPAAADSLAQCDATPGAPSNGVHISDNSLSPDGGSSSTATSDLATLTSVGHYCFRADYQGDSLYPASSDRSLTECFAVTPVTPRLTTQASGAVLLGSPISDTAMLAGTANKPGTPIINPTTAGGAAGGTITFTAFGPNDCSTVAFTSGVSVIGDGSYGSGSFTPLAVGTYTFVASYGGDSPNTLAVPATACPDTTGTESVLVTDTSSVASGQTWVPNDSATASSGSGTTPLNGTLTITLYESSNCTGTAVAGQSYSKTLSNASTSADRTLTTSNSTYIVSGNGIHTVSWLVTFTSTDGNVSSATQHCETTTVTITN